MEPIWTVGLMTGTVLDGNIDVALLKTDGERVVEFGPYTLAPYSQSIRRLLEESHARVRTTLEHRRQDLEALALLLMQQEVVDRKALLALLGDQTGTDEPTTRPDLEGAKRDPVCGMPLDGQRAGASTEYEGEVYLFCSEECRKEFERDPRRFARDSAAGHTATQLMGR